MSTTQVPAPTAVPSTLAIRAESISRRYGSRWALRNVSFELAEGRTLLVAGRNGSGKSTLFRVLTTAIRAHRGQALVAGHPLDSVSAIRRCTALLTHQSYLYDSLTARENLAVVAQMLSSDSERIDGLLEEVGLSGRAHEPISGFSAGMKKRLAFARVLLQDARIIFLDEPFGQLDPAGVRFVERTIARLRAEGRTLLVSTHQLERAAEFCDEAVLLDNGAITWSGSPRDTVDQFRGNSMDDIS